MRRARGVGVSATRLALGAAALAAALAAAPPPAAAAEPAAIDILFVLDDSGSTAMLRRALFEASPAFFEALSVGGELPSLHLGVVSPNVGIGGYAGIQNCEGDGDGGRLQSAPRGECTTGPEDVYVSDVPAAGGTRERNYPGSLEDILACIGDLGDGGCGFEQPLEAARRALDPANEHNAGFLREEAFLLVVILMDEDDCSALDPRIFNPDPSLWDELGPLASFRCTQHGLQCGDPPRFLTGLGAYEDCAPREGSQLGLPSGYAAMIKATKADRSRVGVVALAGPTEPVVVIEDDRGWNRLQPSCLEPHTSEPAIRLADFTHHFAYGRFLSVCSPALAAEVRDVGSEVAAWMSGWAPTPPDAASAADGPGAGGDCACRAAPARPRAPARSSGLLALLAALLVLGRRPTIDRDRRHPA